MNSELSRRSLLLLGLAAPIVACEKREPETPLAHLYGQDWVKGAYAYYAKTYLDLYEGAQKKSFVAYKHLAQKGITALDGLQEREVPFYVRVAPDASSFRIERDVPDRLTFTADMDTAEREAATRGWKNAREHIHTDYAEIQRLDWALTSLLTEVAHVRNAIDQGALEEFRICRQLGTLRAGGELPFRLPYQVTRDDYQRILLLLLERLESDRERLRRSESAMIAVGLTARATDAESASLAINVKKVLLAVLKDSEANAAVRGAEYPGQADERAQLLARAQEIERRITSSPDYRQWLASELEKEDQLGKMLTVLDTLTGLPTSAVYRQVMRVWRGGGDYLDLLKVAVAIVPSGTGVSAVLHDGVDTTVRSRDAVRRAGGARAMAAALADKQPEAGAYELDGGALVNVGTAHARRRLERQLSFFRDAEDAKQTAEELRESVLQKSE